MPEFDFSVRRENRRIQDTTRDDVACDSWCVFLPHQCDAWDIAGETDGPHMDGVSHADAVAALERFIAEAQEALEALKARREIEEPSDG